MFFNTKYEVFKGISFSNIDEALINVLVIVRFTGWLFHDYETDKAG